MTPVVVRSTTFPSNPTTAIARQLGELITHGGRRTVVEDSDWRVMLAMRQFRREHQDDAAFDTWLQQTRPLSNLKSLGMILNLDHLMTVRIERTEVPEEPTPVPTSKEPHIDKPKVIGEVLNESGPILVGKTDDRAQEPVELSTDELTRHAAFLGSTGSGKTTVALNVVEQLLLQGIPALLVDRKGDLCGYARPEFWSRPLDDPAREARRARLRDAVDIALYTPGNPHGRPLSITIAPPGLSTLGYLERGQVAKYSAAALGGMMNYGMKTTDQARQVVLAKAIETLAQSPPDHPVTLEELIKHIGEKDAGLISQIGYLDTKNMDKLVQDLEVLRLSRGELLSARGEPLDAEALLGLGTHRTPGKTRLSIISTKFLGGTQDVQFWVSQLLVELAHWANRQPSKSLQAVLLFDEADQYLPAMRQPPTKEPMENLLKRARSAGIGLFLASQSPGDFDYKCRDNIRTWFVGKIKEDTSVNKLKPMFSESRLDVAKKLPTQEIGQFHVLRDGSVTRLKATRSLLNTEQLPEDEILALAGGSRGGTRRALKEMNTDRSDAVGRYPFCSHAPRGTWPPLLRRTWLRDGQRNVKINPAPAGATVPPRMHCRPCRGWEDAE